MDEIKLPTDGTISGVTEIVWHDHQEEPKNASENGVCMIKGKLYINKQGVFQPIA